MWPPPQAAGELPAREAAANGASTNSVTYQPKLS